MEFTYTVLAGDNGVVRIDGGSELQLNNGALIQDFGTSNNSGIVLPSSFPDPNVLLDNAGPQANPTITLINSNTDIAVGDELVVNVSYAGSQPYYALHPSAPAGTLPTRLVLTGVGWPALERVMSFDGGLGTGASPFFYSYEFVAADVDGDGVALRSTFASGGVILDSAGNARADIAAPNPDFFSVIRVTPPPPRVQKIQMPPDNTYDVGRLLITVSFDADVQVQGVPELLVRIGSNTVFAPYSQPDSASNRMAFAV